MISNLKRSNDFMKKFRKLTQSKRKKPQPVRAVRSDSLFFPIHFRVHESNRVHRRSISWRSS